MIVIESCCCTVRAPLSVTRIVKFDVPAVVGVPVIAPVDPFNVKPAGKLPTIVAHDVDRLDVMSVELFERGTDLRFLDNFRQRFVLNSPDDFMNEFRTVARFDHEHQAHRGFLQFYRRFCVRKLCTVDDICPVNQVIQVWHWTAENRPCYVSNKLRA